MADPGHHRLVGTPEGEPDPWGDQRGKGPAEKTDVLGIGVTPLDYSEIENLLIEWLNGDGCRTVMTMSFPMVGEYVRRLDYRHAIDESQVVLPDGMAVVWLSRLFAGASIRERLSGPDFFLRFSRTAAEMGLRYCLLGSTPEVLDRMKRRLGEEFPGIVVSGAISPPFGEWNEKVDADLVKQVNESRAHVLWIGITAPRQEIWLDRQRSRLHPPIAAAIGAGFDFFAGTRKRAPLWMQRAGLEWLHRSVREPFRIFPRYIRNLPAVIRLILRRGKRI